MADRPSILILGATGLVGTQTTHAAVDADCAVTAVSRGRTPGDLPADIERIELDRDAALGALADRTWDAVIDVCAYRPEQVDRTLDALGKRLAHYCLVSSISATDLSVRPVPESQPGVAPPREGEPDYGQAKAECERVVARRLGARGLVVRPGLIGGPGDRTDRATHWARRAARGGMALAPGSPADILQLIDARDLGPFLVSATLDRITGVLHAVGHPTRWDEFLADVAAGTGETVQWHWVSAEVLSEHGVTAWRDLPMWVPGVGPFAGACHVDRSRADEAGLFTRNPATTALDALRWREQAGLGEQWPGLAPEREAAVLRAVGAT